MMFMLFYFLSPFLLIYLYFLFVHKPSTSFFSPQYICYTKQHNSIELPMLFMFSYFLSSFLLIYGCFLFMD